MGKILSSLIVFAIIAGAVIALLVADTVGEQAALNQQQERRHREELHQVRMEVEQEKATQAIISSRRLAPATDAAKGIMVVGGASTLAGVGYYIVQLMRRRGMFIWPNSAGIFPVVEIDLGDGVKVAHDPNRQPTATTVYSRAPDGRVQISPVQLPGLEDSVRQAAAVQLTAAAVHKGTPLTDTAQNAAKRMFPQDVAQRLPEIEVSEIEPAHIERLLEADHAD